MIQPWPGEEMLMPMQVFHSSWLGAKGAPEDSERGWLYLLLDKRPLHCKGCGADVAKYMAVLSWLECQVRQGL